MALKHRNFRSDPDRPEVPYFHEVIMVTSQVRILLMTLVFLSGSFYFDELKRVLIQLLSWNHFYQMEIQRFIQRVIQHSAVHRHVLL